MPSALDQIRDVRGAVMADIAQEADEKHGYRQTPPSDVQRAREIGEEIGALARGKYLLGLKKAQRPAAPQNAGREENYHRSADGSTGPVYLPPRSTLRIRRKGIARRTVYGGEAMSGCSVVLLALVVFTVVWIGTMYFEWRLEKSRRRWMERTMNGPASSATADYAGTRKGK